MQINDITKALRNGTWAPGELGDFQMQLAGEFAFISSRLEEILKAKPSIWLQVREKTKSDAAADKKWESTPEGIEETIYNLQLKAISKQMSAINSRLHIANLEARSQI